MLIVSTYLTSRLTFLSLESFIDPECCEPECCEPVFCVSECDRVRLSDELGMIADRYSFASRDFRLVALVL